MERGLDKLVRLAVYPVEMIDSHMSHLPNDSRHYSWSHIMIPEMEVTIFSKTA